MNEYLRVSIDHLLEGVQVVGTDWRYLYVNDTAARHGQRTPEDLIGRTMMECYPGIDDTELFTTLRAVMDERTPQRLRNEFVYPTGERRWFDLRIQPVPSGICVLSIDVTDEHLSRERLRALERELEDAKRLEALGRLAGGIAHDFNNQLTAILGFTQLLLDHQTDEAVTRDLREVQGAAERSASLTRQLLAFSRRRTMTLAPVDLNDVVGNLSRLLERVLPANVACEVRCGERLDRTLGDTGQLEHVLTNLVLNARDAMPAGGRLAISTGTVELTDDDARQHPSMKSGRYTVLTVADTGHGMDEETQARIFDPFFTTKGAGKGTGLGLATVYGVVTQMGGFVRVYSERGRGTTFRLYFPPAPDAAVEPAPLRRAAEPRARGGETVLVVEDDRAVRELAARVLRRHGYVVAEAASAEDARGMLSTRRGPDLLLVDVMLPGQSGPDFIRDLHAAPVPTVFMSGYSELILRHSLRDGAPRILEKPFTGHDLVTVVRQALDR